MDNYAIRISAWAQVPDASTIRCTYCRDGSVELSLGDPGLDLYFTEKSARRCLEHLSAALAAPAVPAATDDEAEDAGS